MTIIDKIRDNLQEYTGTPCYYQSEEELNRIFDNGEFPCTFFQLLTSQQVVYRAGSVRERVQVAIFFADKAEGVDFVATQNETIIDAQKRLAFNWLLSLRLSEDLQLVTVNGSERAYAEYDIILTGYALRVTLEETAGVYKCVEPEPEPEPEPEEWSGLKVKFLEDGFIRLGILSDRFSTAALENDFIFQISRDKGNTWEDIWDSGQIISRQVQAEEEVYVRANGWERFLGNTEIITTGGTYAGDIRLLFLNSSESEPVRVELRGSIMSLLALEEEEFTQITFLHSCEFAGLFQGTGVTTIPELPNLCATGAYYYMFAKCPYLEDLSSYKLPVEQGLYKFSGQLFTYEDYGFYFRMFYLCENLVKSPQIMLRTLVKLNPAQSSAKSTDCYPLKEMFSGCLNLREITCLLDKYDEGLTVDWVRSVWNTGLFIKARETAIVRGSYAIPEGWEVQDYEE